MRTQTRDTHSPGAIPPRFIQGYQRIGRIRVPGLPGVTLFVGCPGGGTGAGTPGVSGGIGGGPGGAGGASEESWNLLTGVEQAGTPALPDGGALLNTGTSGFNQTTAVATMIGTNHTTNLVGTRHDFAYWSKSMDAIESDYDPALDEWHFLLDFSSFANGVTGFGVCCGIYDQVATVGTRNAAAFVVRQFNASGPQGAYQNVTSLGGTTNNIVDTVTASRMGFNGGLFSSIYEYTGDHKLTFSGTPTEDTSFNVLPKSPVNLGATLSAHKAVLGAIHSGTTDIVGQNITLAWSWRRYRKAER